MNYTILELKYCFKDTDRPNELTRHKKREHVAGGLFKCDFCDYVSDLSCMYITTLIVLKEYW